MLWGGGRCISGRSGRVTRGLSDLAEGVEAVMEVRKFYLSSASMLAEVSRFRGEGYVAVVGCY